MTFWRLAAKIANRTAVSRCSTFLAFNSIRRDFMFEAVETHVPKLLPFLDTAYSEAHIFQFGEFAVSSEQGVQQGDPLGHFLFCLTVARLLNDCDVDFVGG